MQTYNIFSNYLLPTLTNITKLRLTCKILCKSGFLSIFSSTFATQDIQNKQMARAFFIIFGCLGLGEFIVWATGIKLPSSIIGMLMLTLFLKIGWVKLDWIERMSKFLIANLGFFFVPPGVAIMLYLDIIKAQWLPITVATIVSTVLVLIVTGHMHQFVIKCERKIGGMDLLHRHIDDDAFYANRHHPNKPQELQEQDLDEASEEEDLPNIDDK